MGVFYIMDRRIAIVEDQPGEAELLSSFFIRFGKEQDIRFTLDCFSSAEAFLCKYRPVYDIVFMDIQLAALNGMDAAIRLREIDKEVMLVFVTNMVQYAVKGYEVRAFDFMVKPLNYPVFSMKLQRMLSELNVKTEQELMVPMANQLIRISASQLKYIEVSGHKLIFHTTDRDITAYSSLKSVESELDSRVFVRCNSGYLVNLKYVKAVKDYTVIVDQDELPISRPKRKAFVQALGDYLGGKIS